MRQNPKKNHDARRARNNLGVYVGYVFKHLKQFRGGSGPQIAINRDLFRRATIARRQGGYFKLNQQ